MIGRAISHYSITEKLGEGGMGVVYRAHDLTLKRDVALKFLTLDRLEKDPQAREKVVREAQTISALNHPNICTIYEVGEDDGQPYIAMEFVEGHSLAQEVLTGPLSADVTVRYGTQLADALAHAHERGIVHRDLKSGNVWVTPSGRLKLLDFGLSQRVVETGPGEDTTKFDGGWDDQHAVTGTLAYMAPELLRGQEADARSDVWALGVVLYEMATGKRPFRGGTSFELSASILREPPPSIVPPVPPVLQAVIEKCLDKDPSQRDRSGGEVRAALEAAATASRSERIPFAALALQETEQKTERSQTRLWYGVGIFVVVVMLIAGGVWYMQKRQSRLAMAPGAIQSLAVLPLENLSGDASQEYFADGMTDELITDLAQISALRIISRTSVMVYKGARKPLPQIARELNVDAVVEGTVLRSGNQVRITAQLIEAATDKHLWSQNYEGELRDTLALQNRVASAIADQIRINLTPREQAALKSVKVVNPIAYESYLKGRYFWNKRTADGLRVALAYFKQASGEDPNYAQAYSGLADTYALLGDWQYAVLTPKEANPQAKAAALKAVELDSALGEAHNSLAFVLDGFDWKLDSAGKEFRRAIELNPGYATAHHWYAGHLALLGQYDEAIAEMKKAESVDPLSLIINADLAELLVLAHSYDEAIGQSRRTIEMDPNFAMAHNQLAQAYLQKH